MIQGRFLKVVTNLEDLKDILSEITEGYGKVSWREEEKLFAGYILIRRGLISGIIVEEVITRQKLFGEEGLSKIREAIRDNKVHAVELYEADVDEITQEYPKSIVNVPLAAKASNRELNDVEEIIDFLKHYRGELEIHNNSMAWSIYVENGMVRDATTIKGPKLYGDEALKELLHNMGHLIKDGTYKVKKTEPPKYDSVTNKTALLEGLELLNEKRKFEKETYKRALGSESYHPVGENT